jgi:hypothetical protein
VDTQGTARALRAVFDELEPHLPAGSGIKVSPRNKWTIVQRADAGSVDLLGLPFQVTERNEYGRPRSMHGSGISLRGGLGPWVPFLSRQLRRRLAAQEALETLLRLFYIPAPVDGFHRSVNYSVTAISNGSGLILSYTLPGTSAGITLRPLSETLFE